MPEEPTIAIRLAHPDEDAVVRRLAALDSAPVPRGPALLALVDDRAVGALGLHDGAVVADPFVATADLVQMLRARAEHLPGRPYRGPVRDRRRAVLVAAVVARRRRAASGGRA